MLGLSVVMPTWNEAARIVPALERLRATPGIDEIVVCDCGSGDGTARLAGSVPGVRVVPGARGRGRQLNTGARHATGDLLLFLHADCRLPQGAAARIRAAMADDAVVAGAFRTRHVLDGPHPAWIRPVLPLADLRSHYTRHPYGDQALFVRAETFRRVGGYAPVPLMEDVDLARRLWRHGRVVIVPDRVEVSARRYAARPLRAALAMNAWPFLWRLGIPERTLAGWYGNPR